MDIDAYLSNVSTKSAKPDWLSTDKYSLKIEKSLNDKINKNIKSIEKLVEDNNQLNQKLDEETIIKDLLYETGKPLEFAVNKAFQILGFNAENYNDGKLELDSVIISPEGERYIGECEGKDTKDIDISKFRQLTDSLAEDFERENTFEKAYGLLIGNPQRLIDVAERTLDFTDKCKRGALREKVGLIKSTDLFNIARYLSESDNDTFRKQCRECIKLQLGNIISFPSVPQLE